MELTLWLWINDNRWLCGARHTVCRITNFWLIPIVINFNWVCMSFYSEYWSPKRSQVDNCISESKWVWMRFTVSLLLAFFELVTFIRGKAMAAALPHERDLILKLLDKHARFYDFSNRLYWFRRQMLQCVWGFILLALAMLNSVISIIYVLGQISPKNFNYCSKSTYTHQYLLIYEVYQFFFILPILLTAICLAIIKVSAALSVVLCPGVLKSCSCR